VLRYKELRLEAPYPLRCINFHHRGQCLASPFSNARVRFLGLVAEISQFRGDAWAALGQRVAHLRGDPSQPYYLAQRRQKRGGYAGCGRCSGSRSTSWRRLRSRSRTLDGLGRRDVGGGAEAELVLVTEPHQRIGQVVEVGDDSLDGPTAVPGIHSPGAHLFGRSIIDRGYGFRARDLVAPRNDDCKLSVSNFLQSNWTHRTHVGMSPA
jgi:hypothetical protein